MIKPVKKHNSPNLSVSNNRTVSTLKGGKKNYNYTSAIDVVTRVFKNHQRQKNLDNTVNYMFKNIDVGFPW